MDKILSFLTKPLVDEAAAIIDKKGYSSGRKGKMYSVCINEREYPFKLLITEASKIVDINLSSNSFISNESNRNGFQKLTGYKIIKYKDSEYIKFKKLLGYFVVHLEWVVNENKDNRGFEEYLAPFIENNTFKKTGQGYAGAQIQRQIGKWEDYKNGKICINIQPNFGNYKSTKAYLNWLSTGLNIIANWKGDKIESLYQEEYTYWEDHPRRIAFGDSFSIDSLGLFDFGDSVSNNLRRFYETYNEAILRYKNLEEVKKMKLAIKTSIDLLKYKKQIILQGPPGTGKTREAKLIAVEMLGLNSVLDLAKCDQFKLLQFHPSYSYEDFVRGIIAESKNEKVVYRNVNKPFGLFAEDAMRNYRASNNSSSESKIESWIETNFEEFKANIEAKLPEEELVLSGDISIYDVTDSYFKYAKTWQTSGYLKFSEFKKLVKAVISGDLELSNRKVDKDKFIHAHYRYTYYSALLKAFFDQYMYQGEDYSASPKNYVFVIDEINRANLSSVLGELIYALEYRGEPVESMYGIGDDHELVLPPNLYIIGTMNTADRSVGHIDYAIRRRFAFVDVLPKNLKEAEGLAGFDEDLFNQVSILFDNHLSPEFEKKDVQLGHSYFIDKIAIEDGVSMAVRLKYEIMPILMEYVRDGVLVGESIQSKIRDLKATI